MTHGEFWVPGKPIPMPRPRAFLIGGVDVARFQRVENLRARLSQGQVALSKKEFEYLVDNPATSSTARIVSNTGEVKAWKEAIAWVARAMIPVDAGVPLEVLMVFRIQPPKSLLRKNGALRGGKTRQRPTGARDGDVDNYAKAVLDACNGVLYQDDSQVVSLSVEKTWTTPDLGMGKRGPGVYVQYTSLEPVLHSTQIIHA